MFSHQSPLLTDATICLFVWAWLRVNAARIARMALSIADLMEAGPERSFPFFCATGGGAWSPREAAPTTTDDFGGCFEEFAQRTLPGARRLARILGVLNDDVDDLLQDVYGGICKNWRGSLSGTDADAQLRYLRQAIHNRVKDLWKDRARERGLRDQLARDLRLTQGVDGQGLGDVGFYAGDLHAIVREVLHGYLRRLPDDRREWMSVVAAMHFEGFSTEEIAEELSNGGYSVRANAGAVRRHRLKMINELRDAFIEAAASDSALHRDLVQRLPFLTPHPDEQENKR